MIGSKVSAHWDAERANEVKTLQSRFITDNIHVLYALAPIEQCKVPDVLRRHRQLFTQKPKFATDQKHVRTVHSPAL
jgi:hypothetical protein